MRTRIAVGAILSVAVAFNAGCATNLSKSEWSVTSVPTGAWKVGVKMGEDGNRSVIAEIDSLETGKAIIAVARGLLDEAAGFPVLSTASNILSKWLGTIDPGKGAGSG